VVSKQDYPVVIAILVLAGLAGLNVLAFQNFWYWRLWWFDLLMHGLGGFAIALLAVYAWRRFVEPQLEPSLVSQISVGWAAVIVISLTWELFEFTVDQSARLHLVAKDIITLQAGVADTLGDIISALVGGLIGGLLIHRFSLWQTRNQD
jgi:hypothetical protein